VRILEVRFIARSLLILPVLMDYTFAAVVLVLGAAASLLAGAYYEREARIERLMAEAQRSPYEPRLFTYHANTRPPARESRHGDPE
jgi:hypothetical protein